jgi:hypothetical protein
LFRRLDQAFGYPPDTMVEKFQQRLKDIKAINEYNQLMEAIRINDVIESSHDVINFLKSSVEISNLQGYTRIQSPFDERNRTNHSSTYDDRYSNHPNKRQKR